MKILSIGDKTRMDELALRLPATAEVNYYSFWEVVKSDNYEMVFDLNFDDFPRNMEYFSRLENVPVIVSAVKKRLAEAVFDFGEDVRCKLIGMNLLPGFIHRDLAEVSLPGDDKAALEQVMQQLGWQYRIVDDRAGMVTPRIVCMIINEACYTLQEGTASVADIDLAMKLGVNYPHGPFEWAEKIGIKDVYETLLAIYNDTHDERYQICPLLKTKYLKGESFINLSA